MSTIDLILKLAGFIREALAAINAEELTDEQRANLKAERDALNQRLAELDVPTDPPPSE